MGVCNPPTAGAVPGERRAELAPFRDERRAGRAPFRAGLESSRPPLGRLHLESSRLRDCISSRPRARTSDVQPRGNDLYTSHYNSHRFGCGSSTSPIVIQSSTRGGRPLTSAYSMHVLISSPGLTLPQVPCGCGNPCRSDAHGEATSVGATDHKVRLEASASRDETVRAVLHGEGGSPRCERLSA